MAPIRSLRCLALAALAAPAASLEVRRAGALEVPQHHPWPTARGPQSRQFGFTDVVVPRNYSGALKWKWQNPEGRFHSNFAGGPVIDAGGNLYFTMNDGVRKLSPEGKVLWFFPMYNKHLNNAVCLYGDRVFGSTQDGGAFALDGETGQVAWLQKLAGDAGNDAGYPGAYDGVFLMGGEQGNEGITGGNRWVFAMDTSTGEPLWKFRPEWPVWNFAPVFPGDGTTVFMDFTGSVYRLGLRNGTLLWKSASKGNSESFSDGGVTLGPNGAVYSCSNVGAGRGKEGSTGILRALRVADGTSMWEQALPQPCNSYPAVGELKQGQGLSVVVTPGSFMGSPNLHGSILAFDATTGAPQWRYNAPLYTKFLAKGDAEGMLERRQFNVEHAICLPAHWSSANIAGDGTVFAGRSDGQIYTVRGPPPPPAGTVNLAATSAAELNADFASTPGLDVQTWDADGAAMHGAFAFAPGAMAFATCDTLYYFKL